MAQRDGRHYTSIRLSLTPGTRLGLYEITASIGTGGPALARALREVRRRFTVALRRPRP